MEVIDRTGGIQNGGRVVLKVKMGPINTDWVLMHRDFIENRQFCDIQLKGPFQRWEHTHRFEPDGPAACQMEDTIDYTLPGGPLGSILGSNFTQHRLERLFHYRHQVVAQDLALQRKYASSRPLRILISGSTGLMGSALVPFFTTGGHEVVRLVRSVPRSGEDSIQWNPAVGQLDTAALEGFDVVIHLAGENIAGRWTEEKNAVL